MRAFNHFLDQIFKRLAVTDTLETIETWPNALPALPTELIILIIENIPDSRDLARVCRASKLLRAIAEPLLYRRIDINTQVIFAFDVFMTDLKRLFALYKSLVLPSRALLVTDIRIDLDKWITCPDSRNQPVLSRRNLCSCARYDRMVGMTLALLHSLKSLEFSCSLCPYHSNHAHEYLRRLVLPHLTAFRYACRCHCSYSLRHSVIVALPYVATITALSIDLAENPLLILDSVLIVPGVLPNIKSLVYDTAAFSNQIIRSRPISRVCSMVTINHDPRGHPPGLHEALRESPGRLTHLYYGNILSGLKDYLLISPQPYLHLTAIGTLVFNSQKVSS